VYQRDRRLAWIRIHDLGQSNFSSCFFVSSSISFTIGPSFLLLLLLYILLGFQRRFVWERIFLVFSRSFSSLQPFLYVVRRVEEATINLLGRWVPETFSRERLGAQGFPFKGLRASSFLREGLGLCQPTTYSASICVFSLFDVTLDARKSCQGILTKNRDYLACLVKKP
jgi:hypothetical protein